jgi:chromosome segregation protein
MADARHVQFARELEARDATIAGALARVHALQADVEELRAHAVAAERFRERAPQERARLERALEEARAEVATRAADVAAAEAELERARDGEPRAAAERAVARARDAATDAGKRLARVEAERDALEREAAANEARAPKLEARAAELAKRLEATPRATAAAPTEPVEWTSRARASLFSAAASLETERDRVVREANELAAAALGDATYAASVSLVREQIERAG